LLNIRWGAEVEHVFVVCVLRMKILLRGGKYSESMEGW